MPCGFARPDGAVIDEAAVDEAAVDVVRDAGAAPIEFGAFPNLDGGRDKKALHATDRATSTASCFVGSPSRR
jgi:hypothetical protein